MRVTERRGRTFAREEQARREKIDVVPYHELEIIPFLCIDSSWAVRYKWLWDDYAGPGETYTGYINYIDDIPWNGVLTEEGGLRTVSPSAQAQYVPTYAGDVIGEPSRLIRILEMDGLADKQIVALLRKTDHTVFSGYVSLRRIFNKDYGEFPTGCPIAMSRPVSYDIGDPGNLCDNAYQSDFCTAVMACDGIEGLRVEGINRDRQFYADYLLFSRDFRVSEIGSRLPRGRTFDDVRAGNPRLIVYMIGTGSIGRIKVNGVWHIVSPGYFPAYGDPYNFLYNGHRAFIMDPGINFVPDEMLELDVELVAPRTQDLGAQVVFAIAYDVAVSRPTPIK